MSSSIASDRRGHDIVSLSDRMVYVQALRLGLVGVVLASAFLAPSLLHADIGRLTMAAAFYLLCSAAVESVRRLTGSRTIRALGWMLLADGIFIAWAMYATGGTQSPLRFLAYVHIIAVTLAASYRTGLKIALWHSLLFFVIFYSQVSGWLASTQELSRGRFDRASIFNVLALWLVALTTATFSALNERQLRKRRDDFSALAHFAGALQDCRTVEEVSATFIASAREAFGSKGFAVLASRGEEIELVGAEPRGSAPTTGFSGDATLREIMDRRETRLVRTIDETVDPGLARLMPFARNLVVVPLVAENETIGVVVIQFEGGLRGVERRVVSMLEQFSAHASLALRNAWLLQQVHTLASTDALTGVANRRTFQENLSHELSRSRRTGEPLTLVMVDVDHFKKINDELGHLTGDRMLKEVAWALEKQCRDFDSIARFGGEEFCVLLPGCTARESLPTAERLRKAVASIQEPTTPTASAGVATFPTHCDDTDGLIRAADEALYESKRAGRDRVTRSRRRPEGKSQRATTRAQVL